MVDLNETKNQPEKQFYEQLDDARAGMLQLENSSLHSQPMTPSREEATKTLWFFAKADSELVKEIRAGKTAAHFSVVGKSHDYHACAMGSIKENRDDAKIEKFWNPVVAAWYEHGKEDPNMTLLEFDLETATIWGSTDNSMRFGWEIAKSNLVDEKTPDVGVRTQVKFR